MTGYDEAGNKNMTCQYKWKDGAWVGSGYCTLTTFNGSKKPLEVINQVWSSETANWVNYTRNTTVYEGSKTTQEATYTWSTEANDWVGNTRSDWHYNAKGQNDTIKTYTNNGSEWIYSDRTAKTYNAAGTEIMVHNAHWSGSAWVMTSMTRKDISDVTEGGVRQTLNASWKCNADSVWIGVLKDTAVYSATNKKVYEAHYISWENNDWVPSYRIEYEYDNADRKIFEQRFDWSGDAWKGNYRNEYAFDEQGRQYMTARYVNWNSTTSTWIGSTKTEQTFDENGRVAVSISSFWGTDTWRPAFRYAYTYDASGREIEQVTESYANDAWSYLRKSAKEYKGNVLVKDNTYVWLSSQWMYTSRNESYYDDDAQAKLRREVVGSWDSNNGELLSFSDDRYFYACDPKLAFTIRFENENGVLLESQEVKNGAIPVYGGEKPTKENTAQYTYSFKGWNPSVAMVKDKAVYTAVFDSVAKTFCLLYVNHLQERRRSTPERSGSVW